MPQKKCFRLTPSVYLLVLMMICGHTIGAQRATDLVDYVSTHVGTLSDFGLSNGNTYPVIARPWGMNGWTPQTGRMGDGWQYTYQARKIRGIKQTHQPSPWINDYGQFVLMPTMGQEPIFDEEQRASYFSHKAELATPYSYQVYLASYDTEIQISPTERAAVMRVRFAPQTSKHRAFLLIDALDGLSEIRRVGTRRIEGFSTKNSGGLPANFRCFFVLDFDRDLVDVHLRRDSSGQQGVHSRLAVEIQTNGHNDPLLVHIASSFISPHQAVLNLGEVCEKSFEQVSGEGRKIWNQALGRINVSDSNDRALRTFYSCLYRSLLFPRRFYEYDEMGQAIHYSPYNGQVLPGYMYTDTGFWDTFRALFPLLTLVYPEENRQIQQALINAYKESGFFPEWASPGHRDCMIGNNSTSVLADALLHHCGATDTATLAEGLIHGANTVHPTIKSVGRLGYEYYNRLGYVPSDVSINESAARTLEYAYNDWCIAQVLRRIGDPRANIYLKRAQNYRHLFDPSTQLMRGRREDGTFATPFSPFKWGGDFTEGNAWHYTWSVFHDIAGLIDLMGGNDAFIQKMDSVFSLPPLFDCSYYGFVIHEIREMQIAAMGQYAHGNQPMQHFLYLYNYTSQPWKAQERIRKVMTTLYTPDPDGYCGDEDNGQTSAWYVFSALGFYPVCPGTGEYVIGSPLFQKVTIAQPEGNTIHINAANNAADKPYIQTIRLNGKGYDKNYLRFSDLRQGVRIDFVMADQPNVWRATAPSSRPYSMSVGL